MTKALGKRVRELREKRGLAQKDLAHMIGAEQTAISRIEVREGYEPGAFLLYRIATALDTTVDALLDGAVAVKLNAAPGKGAGSEEVSQLRGQVGQLAETMGTVLEALTDIRKGLAQQNKPPRSRRRAS